MRYLLSESSAAIVRELASRRGGVAFAARRIASAPGSSLGGGQWRIETYADPEGGGVAVRVGAGLVAWGAGVTFNNPGVDPIGVLAPGESARVVWLTAAPPIPLVHDPRWPTGGAPECSDPDCDCPEREGDPNGRGGDSGALLLVEDGWTAPEGTTDAREIGRVEVSEAGGVVVEWLQRDTIVARAIVGRRDPGGDEPESVPPCGHPLNSSDDYHPLGSPASGDGGAGDHHPLDAPGDGGYTPLCADSENSAA